MKIKIDIEIALMDYDKKRIKIALTDFESYDFKKYNNYFNNYLIPIKKDKIELFDKLIKYDKNSKTFNFNLISKHLDFDNCVLNNKQVQIISIERVSFPLETIEDEKEKSEYIVSEMDKDISVKHILINYYIKRELRKGLE